MYYEYVIQEEKGFQKYVLQRGSTFLPFVVLDEIVSEMCGPLLGCLKVIGL